MGKNFHFERHSGVDFNRAGVPLLEIVSEPEITSADMAYEYLNALKEILIYGGVSDADMEKGMVRCDVNVSVRPARREGTGQENRNQKHEQLQRRAARAGIRNPPPNRSPGQAAANSPRKPAAGTTPAGITETMRSKEMAHDYRYFPDPDLMPFEPTAAWLEQVSRRVVELPLAKKQRLMRDYQLPAADAQTFVWDAPLGNYFEALARQVAKIPKPSANWVINNLRAKLAETRTTLADLKFKPEHILELIALVESQQNQQFHRPAGFCGNVCQRRIARRRLSRRKVWPR